MEGEREGKGVEKGSAHIVLLHTIHTPSCASAWGALLKRRKKGRKEGTEGKGEKMKGKI